MEMRRGERDERARRRGDVECEAAVGAGEKRGPGAVGAVGGAVTRLRSAISQGVGTAGGKRTDGLSPEVGEEVKRARRWRLQGFGGSAVAGGKRVGAMAGTAVEVDKQARRWALQGVGNGWVPRKRSEGGNGWVPRKWSEGGSAAGETVAAKASRSSGSARLGAWAVVGCWAWVGCVGLCVWVRGFLALRRSLVVGWGCVMRVLA